MHADRGVRNMGALGAFWAESGAHSKECALPSPRHPVLTPDGQSSMFSCGSERLLSSWAGFSVIAFSLQSSYVDCLLRNAVIFGASVCVTPVST